MMNNGNPECEQIFSLFDDDKDGKITLSQLQDCVALMGGELSDEEAKMVVGPPVSGNDGLVRMEEFINLVESGSEDEKMADLRKAFGMYQMEGEECITPRSLKRMLCRFGEWSVEECLLMIHHFDLNGDGVLSFQEFQAMMM